MGKTFPESSFIRKFTYAGRILVSKTVSDGLIEASYQELGGFEAMLAIESKRLICTAGITVRKISMR